MGAGGSWVLEDPRARALQAPKGSPEEVAPLPKPQFPQLGCRAQLWTPRRAEAGSRTLGTEVQDAPPGGPQWPRVQPGPLPGPPVPSSPEEAPP